MKINKTIKKVLAYVLSLALVVTSLTISTSAVKADDWAFTKAEVFVNEDKDAYYLTVEYNACNDANPDAYWYAAYIDQVDDAHLAIANNDWNWWAEKYSYPGTDTDGNPIYNMVAGRHTFDNIKKSRDGEMFGLGETHTIIVVAYERTVGATKEEDRFTEVKRITQEFTIPDKYPSLSDDEVAMKELIDSFTNAEKNLALSKEGFCSWAEGNITGFTDGNLGAGAQSSVKGEDDFFGVNLGEVKKIGSVAVKWEAACSDEYDIYTSVDGQNYQKAASAVLTDKKNMVCKTTFAAVDAQYVKFVQTKPSDLAVQWGMHPFEVAVFEETDTTPETTTKGEDKPVETTTKAEDNTTNDYSGLTFKQVGSTKYYVAAANNEFEIAEANDQGGNMHLVPKIAEGTKPIWPNFSDPTINGGTEGVRTEGAGIFIDYNVLNDNAYNVFEATSAAQVHQFQIIIKAGNPEGGNEPTPGETTTPAPTTEAPTTEPPTQAPTIPELTFATYAGTGEDMTGLGNWSIWVNTTNNMSIAVDPEDADHIQGKINSNNNNWDQWGAVQYKIKKYGLVNGATYTISVDIKASLNDGVLVSNGGMTADLKDSTSVTITRTAQAENGAIELVIGAGQVGIGVVLDFSNVVVKDAEGKVVETKPEAPTVAPTTEAPTTEAPTTEAPTTEAPTTEAPTTEAPTEAPTTEAPTVAPTTKAPTTTVAPTTKAPVKVKAPGKAKVSKVYAKKLSSKKIKLTLKKVSKAKGYQVAVYTSKKTAKKDTKASKALVKKYTTKVKYTINSKKVKNKKKLYIKVRAYVLNGKTKVYGKWSSPKKVTVKK